MQEFKKTIDNFSAFSLYDDCSGSQFLYLIISRHISGDLILYVGETSTGIFQRLGEHFSNGSFLRNLEKITGYRSDSLNYVAVLNFCLDKYLNENNKQKRQAFEFMIDLKIRQCDVIFGRIVSSANFNEFCNLGTVKNLADELYSNILKTIRDIDKR